MTTAAHSESIADLAAALAKAQAEFTAIPKTSTNPFYKSKYAGLPEVVAAASPVLAKHGLAVSQFLGHDDEGDTLTTWLIHQSGEFIRESMRLHVPKQDAQGQGSATTYARRYAYMAALGLVADEDDDGNRSRVSRSPAPQGPARALVAAAAGMTGKQIKDAYKTAGVEWSAPLFVGLSDADVSRLEIALLNQRTDVPVDSTDYQPPVEQPASVDAFTAMLETELGGHA